MKRNYVEVVKKGIPDTIDLVKEVRADISKTEKKREKRVDFSSGSWSKRQTN